MTNSELRWCTSLASKGAGTTTRPNGRIATQLEGAPSSEQRALRRTWTPGKERFSKRRLGRPEVLQHEEISLQQRVIVVLAVNRQTVCVENLVRSTVKWSFCADLSWFVEKEHTMCWLVLFLRRCCLAAFGDGTKARYRFCKNVATSVSVRSEDDGQCEPLPDFADGLAERCSERSRETGAGLGLEKIDRFVFFSWEAVSFCCLWPKAFGESPIETSSYIIAVTPLTPCLGNLMKPLKYLKRNQKPIAAHDCISWHITSSGSGSTHTAGEPHVFTSRSTGRMAPAEVREAQKVIDEVGELYNRAVANGEPNGRPWPWSSMVRHDSLWSLFRFRWNYDTICDCERTIRALSFQTRNLQVPPVTRWHRTHPVSTRIWLYILHLSSHFHVPFQVPMWKKWTTGYHPEPIGSHPNLPGEHFMKMSDAGLLDERVGRRWLMTVGDRRLSPEVHSVHGRGSPCLGQVIRPGQLIKS